MWLKSVGRIIGQTAKITGQIAGILPVVQQAFPQYPQVGQVVAQASNDIEQIKAIIVTVESMGQALDLKGPDKLKAAAPLVAQAILQSSALANHKIDDAAKFQLGCQKIADGMADVLNALKDD